MDRSHFRLWATSLGVVVLALSCYQLWRVWQQPRDDYWTPPHLAMSLDDARDRLEVLVAGTPMAKVLGDKRLSLVADGNAIPVGPAEVQVRVNDYARVRLMRLPTMLTLAAVAGGAFVLLVIGLFTPLIGAFRPHGMADLHLTET